MDTNSDNIIRTTLDATETAVLNLRLALVRNDGAQFAMTSRALAEVWAEMADIAEVTLLGGEADEDA